MCVLLQPISIEFLRNSFDIYGSLERVEIFHDNVDNKKFAHVTFKENRIAYCALLDCKHNNSNIETIRPADAHVQPDNPIGSDMSLFYNLPEECLLAIFNNCDFHTLALLSTVCKKFSDLLRVRVFSAIPKFNAETCSYSEVKNGLLTTSRLVQCVNPKNFHLKIFRNFLCSIDWPALSLDMKSLKSEIAVEMDFFKSEWLNNLGKTVKRVKSIHLHRSLYNNNFYQSKGNHSGISFPNATQLTISAYAMSCDIPDLSWVATSSPKLENITLRKGTIKWEHILHFCKNAKHLRHIIFENCYFDVDVSKEQIIDVAGIIRKNGNHFPLCLMFDRILIKRPQTVTSQVLEKLCLCLRCSRCNYQRQTVADQLVCGCKVCNKCGLTRINNYHATSTMTFCTKEESTYNELKEVDHITATLAKTFHLLISFHQCFFHSNSGPQR